LHENNNGQFLNFSGVAQPAVFVSGL